MVNETEPSFGSVQDFNGTINVAQPLGQLAQNTEGGDENLRLGFEVHGSIAADRPNDVDVYSFQGTAGTVVWIAVDRTSFSLDSVVELVDADGNVIASSDNCDASEAASATALSRDSWGYQDVYSTNPRDAGLSCVLPGPAGQQRTYYIRVHSAAALSGAEQTSGEYQLQVRLQPVYEHPGSTVLYADIRYATDGIETYGLPGHSPLTADVSDVEFTSYPAQGSTTPTAPATSNDTFQTAQSIGNLLQSDQGMINVSGMLQDYTNSDGTTHRDVDWYKFTVAYTQAGGGAADTIEPGITTGSAYPVVFDIDYADGMARPDTTLWIFDSTGKLILDGTNSGLVDDQPEVGSGAGLDDLTRGSVGTHDPFIGPVYLIEGQTYYIAVTCVDNQAVASQTATDPTVRFEPIDSIQRIAEDNIGSENDSGIGSNSGETTLFPYSVTDPINTLNQSAVPYHLSDVVMYVQTDGGLETVDPFTGAVETTLGSPTGSTGAVAGDLAIVAGSGYTGTLYSITGAATSNTADQNAAAGVLCTLDSGTGNATAQQSDGIITYRNSLTGTVPPSLDIAGDNNPQGEKGGVAMSAMVNIAGLWYVVGNADGYTMGGSITYSEMPNEGNLLYQLSSNGIANDLSGGGGIPRLTTNIIPQASLTTDDKSHTPAQIGNITGLAYLNSNLYAVTDTGQFYQILNYSANGFQAAGDPNASPPTTPTIKTQTGGPSLHWIGTISSDVGAGGVVFEGLTVGPKDITETDPTTGKSITPYANMLFGISRTGEVYALGLTTVGTTTTVAKQAIFVGSATHISTGIGSVSGLAFSTLDANLWHATTTEPVPSEAAGHATTTTYDESRLTTVPMFPGTDANTCFAFSDPAQQTLPATLRTTIREGPTVR